MKTKEELKALKAEVEALNTKLAELNEDELKAVTGGDHLINEYSCHCNACGRNWYAIVDYPIHCIYCNSVNISATWAATRSNPD